MRHDRSLRIFAFMAILVMLLTAWPSALAGSGDYCPKAPIDARGVRGEHVYGKWKVTKEATCKEKGEKARKCKYCGKKKKKSIDKAAHKWGEWSIITEPTETTAGLRERKCKVCGSIDQDALYPEGALKRGDKGDAVRDLQEALNVRGYDCGKADGIFGKKTEQAVKGFQEALGLEQDGIAWPDLIGKLRPREIDIGPLPEGTSTKKRSLTRQIPDSEVEFSKWEQSVPANGKGYYEEGEPITYGFLVANRSEPDSEKPVMRHITLYDSLFKPYEEGYITEFDTIMPGEIDGCSLDYIVTAEDVERGYVENTAGIMWYNTDDTGEEIGNVQEADSETVFVYTAPHEEPSVFLDLEIENSPENGEYYGEGETIKYLLRLRNEGEETLTNVEFFDVLDDDSEDVVVARTSEMKPGETFETHVSHRVTSEDVDAGEYNNVAWVCWDEDQYVSSEAVSAKTSAGKGKHIFKLSGTAYIGQGYDHCFNVKALDGTTDHSYGELTEIGGNLDEFGLDHCAEATDGSGIRVSGTPTQTGCTNCVYMMSVDDVLWEIEIEIIVDIPQYRLSIDWQHYRRGAVQDLGLFDAGSTDYSLPTLSLLGYEFVGWADQNGEPFSEGDPITKDTVLHPKYNVVETFTISFDMDVWEPQPAIRVNKGSTTYKLPVPENKDGYVFTGWRITRSESNSPTVPANTSVQKFTPGDPITANLTLQARHRQTKGFIITFDAGEDHHMQGMKARISTMMTAPDGKLQEYPKAESDNRKEQFEGWYTSDGKRVDDDDDHIFMSNETIYASWSCDASVQY